MGDAMMTQPVDDRHDRSEGNLRRDPHSAIPTRRQFLAALLTAAGALSLAACGAGGSATTTGSAVSSSAAKAASTSGAASTVASSQTAVGSAAAKPTPTIPAALAPITVGGSGGPHLQIWWPYGSKNLTVDNSFTAFQKKHPTWSAEISYTNGFAKFTTAVAGGTPPDVYMPTVDFVLQSAAKGIMLALDSYIARDKVDMGQYFKAATLAIKYKTKTYGMPEHLDVYSIYQNDNLLKSAGLDPTKGPASWDDFATLNQRLTKKNGTTLERLGFVPNWGSGVDTVGWLQYNGVALLNNDGTKVAFDTPAGSEALNWVATQLKEIGTPDALTAFKKPFKKGSGDALAHDQLGMELMGVWDIAYTILKIAPNLALSQWPIPGGPSTAGKSFGGFVANLIVIPAPSKQHDNAWEFVKFHSGPEGQAFIQTAPGAWDIACIPAVANDPAALQAQPWRKRANELMQQAVTPVVILSPAGDDVQKAMNTAAAPLWAGKQDVNTTMVQMKQQAQAALDKYNA